MSTTVGISYSMPPIGHHNNEESTKKLILLLSREHQNREKTLKTR